MTFECSVAQICAMAAYERAEQSREMFQVSHEKPLK